MRLRHSLLGPSEDDEARAVHAGERLEQDIVDDAVHGTGHADPQREREPDDGDEAGAAPEGTRRDADVAQDVARRVSAALAGRVVLIHAAKGAAREIDVAELS